MKHLSFRLGLVTLLACGVIAVCSSSAVAQDAAATYKAKCAMCHGADGKGGKMGTRDFASPEVKAETDAQVEETIAKGKGKMPSYAGKLKDTEIALRKSSWPVNRSRRLAETIAAWALWARAPVLRPSMIAGCASFAAALNFPSILRMACTGPGLPICEPMRASACRGR